MLAGADGEVDVLEQVAARAGDPDVVELEDDDRADARTDAGAGGGCGFEAQRTVEVSGNTSAALTAPT